MSEAGEPGCVPWLDWKASIFVLPLAWLGMGGSFCMLGERVDESILALDISDLVVDAVDRPGEGFWLERVGSTSLRGD